MAGMFALDNRVALVTGASRGLGFAMAKALAENGAHVIVNARDSNALARAAESIGAEAMAFDVTDAAVTKTALQAIVDRHGKLDILVNNAGIQHRRPLTEWQDEDFDRVMEVFKAHNIGYFVYIVGNDSMDTAHKLSILTSLDLFIHSTTYEVPVEFDRTSENIIAQRQGVCEANEECPAIEGCSAEFRIKARRVQTQVNWFNVATGNSASQSGYPDRELEEDFWKFLRAKAKGKTCPATIEAKIKIFDCTYSIVWTCKNCSRS